MKKGKIIGIVIGVVIVVVALVVMLSVEGTRRGEFRSTFGFYPSGTYWGLSTTDPDPKLADREKDLIWKKWEKKYTEIEKFYNETKETEGSDYASLRAAFRRSLKVLKDGIKLAHHFGYRILPDDPKGFLKN